MALDALKAHVVSGLRDARAELRGIKRVELTFASLTKWHVKHNGGVLVQVNQLGGVHSNSYGFVLRGHDASPLDVLINLQSKLIGFLDETLRVIDSTQIIETVLEGHIKRIADVKLSALLLEFNAIKDVAPNAAAIIFRTILMLLIQERAKQKSPNSPLATMTDLNLDPMIKQAFTSNLFDGGEAKFLKLFQPAGKAIFDNIVHKPGANALVDKEYLATVVEPLNKLLATIVQ